jgi:hypothetical protein
LGFEKTGLKNKHTTLDPAQGNYLVYERAAGMLIGVKRPLFLTEGLDCVMLKPLVLHKIEK